MWWILVTIISIAAFCLIGGIYKGLKDHKVIVELIKKAKAEAAAEGDEPILPE